MATYYRWRKSTVIYNEHRGSDTTEDEVIYYNSNCYIQWGYEYDIDTATGEYTITNQVGSITLSAGEHVEIPSFQNAVFYDHLNSVYVRVYTNNYGATITLNDNKLVIKPIGSSTFTFNQLLPQANSFVEYVYSVNGSLYPNGKVKDGYYYDQRTTVTSPTAPSGLTYPSVINTPTVTVSWNASVSNVPSYSVNSYELSYSTNGGSTWSYPLAPTGTSQTIDVPEGATTLQFRIRAHDTNNQFSTYTIGPNATVLLAPTLTVPQMVMQGQSATISWSEVEGADSYTLQRKSSEDADWTQVYSGADLSYTETVGTWTSLQYRVQAVFDETPGGWATSGEIQIVSASALVISGQDGDLGTLTNDVQYSVSSDGSNALTVTESVNGVEIRTFTAANGGTNTISVVDLPTGYGTITITATTTATGGAVSVTRNWTYTKTAPVFGNTGSVADLVQQAQIIWAKTIAEAVRVPGIWGGNLGLALQLLSKAVLYDPETGGFEGIGGEDAAIPVPKIENGTYVGTGTSTVTVSVSYGTPVAIIVLGDGSSGTTPSYTRLIAIKGVNRAIYDVNGGITDCSASFGSNSISLSNTGGFANFPNVSRKTYGYLIFCV